LKVKELKEFFQVGIWRVDDDELPPVRRLLYAVVKTAYLAIRFFTTKRVLTQASALTYRVVRNPDGKLVSEGGTSRRVSDSFAKNNADATWEDITTSRYTVDPEHVRDVFQNLVNAGLFDRDKMFTSTKHPPAGRFIAVRAAFDNKTYSEPQNMFEENPELAERLYNVVLEFCRPVVRRRKPVIGRGPRPEEDKK